MTDNNIYQHPLVGRYSSKEMQYIWSPQHKFETWRRCWIALAKAEKQLGLSQITDAAITQMEAFMTDINFDVAKEKEAEIRHDVMAHVYAYGQQCPDAAGIIHLGATSMLVDDNTYIIQMAESIPLIRKGIVNTVNNLAAFAMEHHDLACLGYSHYQPAQPVTMGKRFCIYMQDLVSDLDELDYFESKLMLRGAKGTTGTQASFLELFDGDYDKVCQLDTLFAMNLGFGETYPVTGQTYPRKLDKKLLDVLSDIGESAHKCGTDIRLLSREKVLEEPFAKNQTGSSAMAYKRNPMRSERMCAISRYLMGLPAMAAQTAAVQWLERTLDDSAIRRMYIPEGFLAADAALKVYQNVSDSLVVYPNQIAAQLQNELPFMATEKILMRLAKQGYSRQEMHEIIKKHSKEAERLVKEQTMPNLLFKYLGNDPDFPLTEQGLNEYINNPEQFAGAAAQQTLDYVADHIQPVLTAHKHLIEKAEDLKL